MQSTYSSDTCTPIFLSALFTIAKLWNQSRCLSINKEMKKMWYIATMEYYSAIKKNEIMSIEEKWM
jgi:hypothetical protein